MAQCEAPDADDQADPSLWFPSHAMKAFTDAQPEDVVADFDQHHDFVVTAAATIKMEIDGVSAIDDADMDDSPADAFAHDDHAFGFEFIQLNHTASSPAASASASASASSPEPSSAMATDGDATEMERRKQLSIERRRKRNREAMQRSRQRDKDYMDGLRDQAADLERVHNELVDQMNKRLSLVSGDTPVAGLQADLEEARQQAQELMEQNLKFQDEITERIKGEDRMEGLLKELLKDQQRNAGALSAILYDYTAPRLTISRAMDIIMMSRQKRVCIQNKRFQTQEHAYNFFGWDIRHHFLDKYLYMKFTKTFRNRTAAEIAERAWNHAKNNFSYRNHPNPRKVQQLLNEDTFIVATDKRDPDNVYEFVRIYNLRFRVKEPDGVICLGTQTLPESFVETSVENIWASDVCTWMMLAPVQECDAATGEMVEHCRVEFVGKTRFGADQLAQQNALETVISLARWEESNVGITPSLLWSES